MTLQSEVVADQTVAEFGLKPGGLGRHDFSGVGDGHELVNSGGIHGESNGIVAHKEANGKFQEEV